MLCFECLELGSFGSSSFGSKRYSSCFVGWWCSYISALLFASRGAFVFLLEEPWWTTCVVHEGGAFWMWLFCLAVGQLCRTLEHRYSFWARQNANLSHSSCPVHHAVFTQSFQLPCLYQGWVGGCFQILCIRGFKSLTKFCTLSVKFFKLISQNTEY